MNGTGHLKIIYLKKTKNQEIINLSETVKTKAILLSLVIVTQQLY